MQLGLSNNKVDFKYVLKRLKKTRYSIITWKAFSCVCCVYVLLKKAQF